MSQRNTLAAKAARREAKKQRKTPTAYFDVIQWVKDRAHMSTGRAIKVLQAGSVKSDSHTLTASRGASFKGTKLQPFLECHYPASIRNSLRVETPEVLKEEA